MVAEWDLNTLITHPFTQSKNLLLGLPMSLFIAMTFIWPLKTEMHWVSDWQQYTSLTKDWEFSFTLESYSCLPWTLSYVLRRVSQGQWPCSGSNNKQHLEIIAWDKETLQILFLNYVLRQVRVWSQCFRLTGPNMMLQFIENSSLSELI